MLCSTDDELAKDHIKVNSGTDESFSTKKIDFEDEETYRKSSIKPPGGLFNFGPSRGGLNREGGLLERGPYS